MKFYCNHMTSTADALFFSGLGQALEDRTHPGFLRIVKRKNPDACVEIPVHWHEDVWSACIPLEKDLFAPGIWDFHLHEHCSGTQFRLLAEEPCTDAPVPFLQPGKGASRTIAPYRTVKGGFSMKVSAANTEVSIYSVSLAGDEVTFLLEGDAAALQEERWSFIERGTGAGLTLHLDRQGENLSLSCPYDQLIPESIHQVLRWDVFIEGRDINGSLHRMRAHIRSAPANLEELSSCLTKRDVWHRIAFYETVQGNLSVCLQKLRIERTLEHASCDGSELRLQGSCHMKGVSLQRSNGHTPLLVIRRRGSDYEQTFNLPNTRGNESEQECTFDLTLPLRQIVQVGKEQAIYDLYIQMEYEGTRYERKLGFEDYTFCKDDSFDRASYKDGRLQMHVHCFLTVFGNLMLKAQGLSLLQRWALTISKKWTGGGRKPIWLIGERPDTAQDTGYHFFEYIVRNHPEVRAFYVMDAAAEDYAKVRQTGQAVAAGSLKHFFLASRADAFFGSHDIDNVLPTIHPAGLASYRNGERIFLQHGIYGRKPVEYDKKHYAYPFSTFCVSSDEEKQAVINKLGYEAEEVAVTGLSRFDALPLGNPEDKSSRSILLMPTWRNWLGSEALFLDSDYYRSYTSLLENEALHSLLESENLVLNFYPHYRMQPYSEHFRQYTGDRIRLVKLGERTVQELLLDADLLVTDYSSVSFDMNYMGKPVVFYHFDAEKFFRNGSVRPVGETFLGNIAHDAEEAIEAIRQVVSSGFAEGPSIDEKKAGVFKYIDHGNCQRIFEACMDKRAQSR